MTNGSDPVQRLMGVLLLVWVGGLAAWGLPPLVAGVLAPGGACVLLLLMGARTKRVRVRAVEETLEETRTMLQERLSGHLHSLLRVASAPDRPFDERERARLAEVVNAAREVETTLELLSPSSLRAWRSAR